MNTPSWKTILNSEIGDVFNLRWMNLQPGCNTYTSHLPYGWIAHLEDYDGYFPDRYIHEWRIPWPKELNHEYIIEDISFIHFARVNVKRQKNKEAFYQVSTAYKDEKYSGIKSFRNYQAYHPISKHEIRYLPENAYAYYEKMGLNIQNEINMDDIGQHYINEMLRFFDLKGLKHYAKLDIWDMDFVRQYNLKNPQSILDKLIIKYLRATKKYSKTIFIRGIDWLLKKVY